MTLADFIVENGEAILAECEAFAKTLLPAAEGLDTKALRNHLADLLSHIARDMKSPQSLSQEMAKSRGFAPSHLGSLQSDGRSHGDFRAAQTFTSLQTVAEYRALRASVVRLWLDTSPALGGAEVDQLVRFNEAVDEALTGSLIHYTQAAAQDRNLFLGVLSHELRTPLGTIVASAEAVLNAAEQKRTHPAAANRVLRASKRMESILSDCLDFVRSGRGGGMRLTPVAVDLDNLCRRIAREVEVRFPDGSVIVETAGDVEGTWDEQRVAQAVSNLINNALKYGAPGEPVRVHLQGANDVSIQVWNSGPSISSDVQKALFQPLVRGTGPDRTGVSLGLGLYIVREIATAHGGTVEVESSDEEGTRFTLRLPRSPAAVKPTAFGRLGLG